VDKEKKKNILSKETDDYIHRYATKNEALRFMLHDSQPAKGGVRDKYSSGNVRGVRKGSMCNFGQVCGGIKEKTIRTYDWDNKRLSKSFSKIDWLSHNFKTNEVRC
jgi:hypothetical protein